MTLKKKKYNLKKMIETKSVKSEYLFDEELLLDYKNNTLPVRYYTNVYSLKIDLLFNSINKYLYHFSKIPETNFSVHKNTSLKPTKLTKKEKTADEKVKIKPKFHRTANLKPSINYETL